MKNYLHGKDRNQNDFYQLRKTIFQDDRIMEAFSRDSHIAAILYTALEDKISLSIKNGLQKYRDVNSKYFCRLSENDAKKELRIASSSYKNRKAFLKEAGLIDYPEQTLKKDGIASNIYVTPWEEWVEKNGLYSFGEWIVEPSSEDFYNPSNIVKVQPNIKKPVEATEEEIAEFESLMNKAKKLGVQFKEFKRFHEVPIIVTEFFGKGKKLTEATTKDLPTLRAAVVKMEHQFKWGELPDF